MDTGLFHFLRPDWLYALIPLALLCLWQWRQSGQRSAWRKIVSAELLPHMLVDSGAQQRRWPLLFVLLAGILAILAMAGPTWERLPTPVFRNDAALVIVLDLSRSMDAQDIKPSRIQRAHFKVTDIIKARTEGQTALIVYAADAFTVTPLTDDGQTIISQLGALTTRLMPAQGSRTDLALELASNLLRQAGLTQGDILLITDEVNRTTGMEAAEVVQKNGYRLSILGIGTAAGAPIPLGGGGMLKDANDNIVIAKLDANRLQQIAETGGGRYATLSTNGDDLKLLDVNNTSRLEDGQPQSDDQIAEVWKEFGPWLLLPLLPIVALAFRRGILILALFFILPLPQPASAADWLPTWPTAWTDMWQTRNQQAQQLMLDKKPQAAAEKFSDPAWKGSAQYQLGDYEKALDNYQSVQGPEARYNEGNTLAKLGRLEDAIKTYDQALKLNPDHEDAKHNRKLVEDALKKQQEQKQKNKDQQQSKDQSKQDQSKQDQSSQDQSDQGKPDQKQSENNSSEQQSDSQQTDDQSQKEAENQSAEQKEEEKEKKAQEQSTPRPDQQDNAQDKPADNMMSAEADELNKEERQAREQWLNRIPDDPAELLRRKFKYQYQQRGRTNSGEQTW